MSVLERIARHAAERPDALAFGLPDGTLTFAGLHDGAARIAAGLAARGLRRGDRVALVMPTGRELVLSILGAQRAGVAPIVLNPSAPAEQLARRAALARVQLTIDPVVAGELLASIAAPAGTVDEDDLAFLQITSGTTGDPKAVMVTHRALDAFIATSGDRLDYRVDDIFATFVPLYHDLGLVCYMFVPASVGCVVHLLHPAIGSLAAWLTTIERERATFTGAPDFAYRIAARTVPATVDLRSLRYACNGGEPPRRATIEAFECRFGLSRIVQAGYGLAEATVGVSAGAPGAPLCVDARGNVGNGRPYDALEVRLGEGGEVQVRGPSIFAGYLDDEAATRAVLDADGWLSTGDMGAFTDDGQLVILGRERALVKRAGALVAPREVEEAVDAVAGVGLSAAVGVTRDGVEDLAVVAETRLTGAERARLVGAISDAVTRAIGFAPAQVVLVEPRGIPRTGSGKIRYGELRTRFGD